ncbi:MAG TPA: hypothetical protein VJ960_07470 [Oceanipulchritudo sp.]|nr:hypothetical protein [Oceanipulchritudo sp.]
MSEGCKFTSGTLILAGLVLLLLSGCGLGWQAGRIEARLEAGLELLEVYDFDGAYAVLSPLPEHLEPGVEDWERGWYAAAVAAWHKAPGSAARIEEATTLLTGLVEGTTDPDRRARYALDLGRIHEVEDYPDDRRDWEEARRWYEQAREWATGEALWVEADLRLAQLHLQKLDGTGTRAALGIVRETARMVETEPWRSTVMMYLGEIEASYADDNAAALQAFLNVDPEFYPVRSRTDGFIWRRALMCVEAGRYEEAIEQFEYILEYFSRSAYRTVARRKIEELEATI